MEERLRGPQILWVGVGAMLGTLQNDRLSFFTVLRRPLRRSSPYYVDVNTPREESLFRGIIDRPIAENQFVQSTFECQVGDIIVLEGGERLRARAEGDVNSRGLCMLVTLYQTVPGERGT